MKMNEKRKISGATASSQSKLRVRSTPNKVRQFAVDSPPESILQLLIESTQSAVFTVDTKLRYTSFNKRHAAIMKALYGQDIEIGESILDYQTVSADREKAKENLTQALQGVQFVAADYSGEMSLSRKYFEVAHSPLINARGQVVGVAVTAYEVTQRRRAEHAFLQSEARFRSVIENAPFGYFRISRNGLWEYVNPVWEKMFGFTQRDIVGKPFDAANLAPSRKFNRESFDRVLHGESVSGEYTFAAAGESLTHHKYQAQPVKLGEEIIGVEGFIEDITEAKNAAEALKISETRFRELTDRLPVSVWEVDRNGEFIYSNRAGIELHGYTWGDPLNLWGVIAPESRESTRQGFNRVLETKTGITMELTGLRKDGMLVPELAYVSCIMRDDEVTSVLGITLDVTERKQFEHKLQVSEQKYRSLFENMTNGLAYCQIVYEGGKPVDFTILNVNQTFERVTGLRSVEGTKLTAVIPNIKKNNPELFEKFFQTAETGKPVDFEILLDGLALWLHFSVYSPQPGHIVAIFEDITRRKKTEEALRASEQIYRSLFDNMTNGLAYCQMVYEDGKPVDFKYLNVNETWYKITGYKDVIGKTLTQVFPDIQTTNPALLNNYDQVARYGQPFGFENYFPLVKSWIKVFAFCPQQGYFVAVVEDTTQRKQAETALRESEQKYRSLFENMINGFAYCQMIYENGQPVDYVYLDTNRSYSKLTGLTNVVGKRVTEVMPTIRRDMPHLFELYGEVAETGKAADFEIYLAPLKIWLHISAYSPQKGYFVAIFENITQRKRAEEALQESEQRFRELSDLLPMSVWEIDTHGSLLYVNQEGQRLHGAKYGQHDSSLEIIAPEDRVRVSEFIQDALRGQTTGPFEYNALRTDGTTFPGLIYVSRVMRYGKVRGLRGIHVDISEQKKNEQIILKSLEKESQLRANLEQQEKQRIEFTRFIVHELKTPLSALLASCDMLVDVYKERPASEVAENILRSANNLNRRVDELYDMAKGEIGILTLVKKETDIYKLVSQLLDEIAPLTAKKKLTLAHNVPPGTLLATIDEMRIRQVLTNLINNAIKFTPEGGKIAVRVTA
ncbi:MAG: PAS domain-containing sensor histidine kinase, partial [Dehalococcoidales bacterium]|nr:PAS domain-containing sensor histidine kinase [Dehalococcoidales bacterium]